MNKKLNTVLFILGATLFNIVVMIILFFVLMVIFARFLAPALPPGPTRLFCWCSLLPLWRSPTYCTTALCGM